MDDRPRYTDRYSKKLTQMTTNVQFGRQATWSIIQNSHLIEKKNSARAASKVSR
jgi:hypothetical protein